MPRINVVIAMAKEFTVIAKLSRDEHRKLKSLLRSKPARVYIKDYVRAVVLRAVEKGE